MKYIILLGADTEGEFIVGFSDTPIDDTKNGIRTHTIELKEVDKMFIKLPEGYGQSYFNMHFNPIKTK